MSSFSYLAFLLVGLFFGGIAGFFSSLYWIKNRVKKLGLDEEKINNLVSLFGSKNDGKKNLENLMKVMKRNFKLDDNPLNFFSKSNF